MRLLGGACYSGTAMRNCRPVLSSRHSGAAPLGSLLDSRLPCSGKFGLRASGSRKLPSGGVPPTGSQPMIALGIAEEQASEAASLTSRAVVPPTQGKTHLAIVFIKPERLDETREEGNACDCRHPTVRVSRRCVREAFIAWLLAEAAERVMSMHENTDTCAASYLSCLNGVP